MKVYFLKQKALDMLEKDISDNVENTREQSSGQRIISLVRICQTTILILKLKCLIIS